MIRTEAERQFYLGVAGVRMWYARDPLPGAAPSPEFDFSVSDTVTEPVAEAPVVQPVARQRKSGEKADGRDRDRINRLQALMDESRGPSESPVQTSAAEPDPVAEVAPPVNESREPEPVSTQASHSETVPGKLILQAWAGDKILLLGCLSEDSSVSLQVALARNIMKALGEGQPEELAPLHWPLFNNSRIELNRSSHLIDLASEYLGDCTERSVVVLGDPGDWLSGAIAKLPDVAFPANLAKLAADPGLKRELWSRIRPLVDHRR